MTQGAKRLRNFLIYSAVITIMAMAVSTKNSQLTERYLEIEKLRGEINQIKNKQEAVFKRFPRMRKYFK